MGVLINVEDNSKEFFEKLRDKFPGYVAYAVGEAAIDFKEFLKPWVYGTDGYDKLTGKLEESISARLRKKNGKVTDEWVIGPNHHGIGNLTAIWIPSAKGYRAATGTVHKGPWNISKDRDFLHKAWSSYTSTNNIKEKVTKALQEKIDGLKQ